MKKVWILWIIAAVLLIGGIGVMADGNVASGIVAIIASAVLGFFGFRTRKKLQEAAAEAARAAEEAEKRKPRRIFSKAVGVTFNNADGQSRQSLLKALMKENKDEDGDCIIPVCLVKTEYKGEPAIEIESELGCIGMIPKYDIAEVLDVFDRITYAEASLERFADEETGETIIRADIMMSYPPEA